MPIKKAEIFNIKDLTLDVRLQAIVGGESRDFTGKNTFSVEFFRKSIGFGITDVEIDVNTSLQPIITITFKDLYGNTVFGKSSNKDTDLSSDNSSPDFSMLFNWPPPKFLFTFKGFLGKSASWMLSMKKTSVSYDSSDGSYIIKCEFVPNQWGFFADLPFIYLLAVKALKKKDGMEAKGFEKIQTIFDLINIGKQVDVKTEEATKEFDGLLNQMKLLKSRQIYDALFGKKIVAYNTIIDGKVNNQTIAPFHQVLFKDPRTLPTGNEDILDKQKLSTIVGSSADLTTLNSYFLLFSFIGGMTPQVDLSNPPTLLTYKKYIEAKKENNNHFQTYTANIDLRISLIEKNITLIENAISKKTYQSSKTQLEKITIGETFKQIALDSGYIMGKILEAGYQGYEGNKSSRDSVEGKEKLIGRSFPLWINSKGEEGPASIFNTGGKSFGVENYELMFVDNFINALSEGVATELTEESTTGNANASIEEDGGSGLIKHRITNAEALMSNPYQPYYQSIAENIMVRSGIAGYLVRSPDPNLPGNYGDGQFTIRGNTPEEIAPLAKADLKNIEVALKLINDEEFRKLKNFCTFWDNMLSDDCTKYKKPSTIEGDNGKLIDGDDLHLSSIGGVLKFELFDYPVVIEGLETTTLKKIMSEIFRPTNSLDDRTNSIFVDPLVLQSERIMNNGIAYFKPPSLGSSKSTFLMFDNKNASKTQSVTSADADAELKNDSEQQKGEEKPKGYVNLKDNKDSDPDSIYNLTQSHATEDDIDNGRVGKLKVVNAMDINIKEGLMLDYNKIINPPDAFYNTQSDSVYDYFLIDKSQSLGDSNAGLVNEIPTDDIAISVVYNPNNYNKLVFGPFVVGDEAITQRGYIKAICSELLTKLKDIEQNKTNIISNALGKGEEQRGAIYKQMHILYQQWETIILADSEYLDCGSSVSSIAPLSKGAIERSVSERFNNHINLGNKDGNKNFVNPNNISNEVADNTFIYSYPLNFFQDREPVNVRNSIISIETLYDINSNTTVLNAIQQICTKNNFMFIPMPGNSGGFSIDEIYKAHQVDSPKIKNFFYVQFLPTPESRSTLRNGDSTMISSKKDVKDNISLDALEITFGSTENQIVKNITVDTSESKMTAESIINLQSLVDPKNQSKKVTTDCSMLPIMEGRSYKATIEMLGNAQVFPMQFFYLDANPLFNGLYQIIKVKHSIKPNDMSTSVEGIRMRVDFQSGQFGGIPPVTLESLDNIQVSLVENSSLTQANFNAAIADAGTTEDSAYAPDGSVITPEIILLPNIKGVGNSIRLVQSTDSSGKLSSAHDIVRIPLAPIKKEDIIRSMNEFIVDVLEPFALFLKNKYPKLYDKWYITSSMRGHIPEGGSAGSQHFYGQAIDSQIFIKDDSIIETMKSNLKLLNAILEWYQLNPTIDYGQILWETTSPTEKSWIHWSYRRNNNQKELSRFSNGKKVQRALVNKTGVKVLPGVTEQQIILSVLA